ncbi:2-oxoacid:ferredoxin oxidoreductase subunit beta, partial [bacterium]|nr:2-oxoacid:ferredoxin oxidoreductase subunit beta [bacterium]
GFHSIHGRAPAVASGVKISNPDLMVWLVTGDGDGLSIGGNHLIHCLRRNMDLKILLFNNRIYGLTKGQYSPTSEQGKKTKSTPLGSLDRPFIPCSVAIGAEATFVARTIDSDAPHLQYILKRAAEHKGSAFVEIYQNCNVFNDGAFDYLKEREAKAERLIMLEQGKPLVYGKQQDKAVKMVHGPKLICGKKDEGAGGPGGAEPPRGSGEVLVHDEHLEDPTYAFMLSRLEFPNDPVPMGVLRQVTKPTYDGLVEEQGKASKVKAPSLEAMLAGPETWTVK